MRLSRYCSVSRCSVKMTSFCFGDGVGRGIPPSPCGTSALRDLPGEPAGCKDFAKQACQLSPFGVRAASPHFKRKTFQILERLDLSLQLHDGSRRRRPVENLLRGRLDFVLGSLFQILDILGVKPRSSGRYRDGDLATTLQHLELTQPALQTLTAAAQRLIDGLR